MLVLGIFFSGKIFFISTTTSYSSDSTICTMDFLKLQIIIAMLWHVMFLKISKLKIVFKIIHINCVCGFRMMTFTIYLIFTSLAGVIFKPHFTTFCSCFVIIFLEKITFLVFSTCCSTKYIL